MIERIVAVLFENGKVDVAVDGKKCSITTSGFKNGEGNSAAIEVMNMLKNFNFSSINIENQTSKPKTASSKLINTFDAIYDSPTFTCNYTKYEVEIISTENKFENGKVVQNTLDIIAKGETKLSHDEKLKVLNFVKRKYSIDELYLFNSYERDGNYIISAAIENNVKQMLSLAKTITSRTVLEEAEVDWRDYFETNDYVTFKRYDDSCVNIKWTPSFAKQCIAENFNIKNVVFIHATQPIIVSKL